MRKAWTYCPAVKIVPFCEIEVNQSIANTDLNKVSPVKKSSNENTRSQKGKKQLVSCFTSSQKKREKSRWISPRESCRRGWRKEGKKERKKRMKHEGVAAKYVLVPQLRQTPCTPAMLAFSPQIPNKVTSSNAIGPTKAVASGSLLVTQRGGKNPWKGESREYCGIFLLAQ
jgi:hypothetical protein